MKIMNWIYTSAAIFASSAILLCGLEASLLFVFGYNEVRSGNTSCQVYDAKSDFSHYKPNCQLFHKHWEQENGISYVFNEFGRRDGKPSSGEELIAFIGDSFTFGAMVPIDKNYNYRAIAHLENRNLGGHNYGVSGEQFHNVLNKLSFKDFSDYQKIVYGLTPNDLFNLVDGSFTYKNDLTNKVEVPNSPLKRTNRIKNMLLMTATSKMLLHNLMSIDSAYLATYQSRQPYAGYLESPLPADFASALDNIFKKISELNHDVKSKLVIFLLPQRAEVVATRQGTYKADFKAKFLDLCSENNITCGASDVAELSKLDESHFPIDGHMTVQANNLVGRQLSLILKELDE